LEFYKKGILALAAKRVASFLICRVKAPPEQARAWRFLTSAFGLYPSALSSKLPLVAGSQPCILVSANDSQVRANLSIRIDLPESP
jgi:hypothetical protein